MVITPASFIAKAVVLAHVANFIFPDVICSQGSMDVIFKMPETGWITAVSSTLLELSEQPLLIRLRPISSMHQVVEYFT